MKNFILLIAMLFATVILRGQSSTATDPTGCGSDTSLLSVDPNCDTQVYVTLPLSTSEAVFVTGVDVMYDAYSAAGATHANVFAYIGNIGNRYSLPNAGSSVTGRHTYSFNDLTVYNQSMPSGSSMGVGLNMVSNATGTTFCRDNQVGIFPNTFTATVHYTPLSQYCSVTLPYIEDFGLMDVDSNNNYIDVCWSTADAGDNITGPSGSTGGDWEQTVYDSDDKYLNDQNGSPAVKVNVYGDDNHGWLISPIMDLTGGGYEVGVDVGVTEYNGTAAEGFGSDDQVVLMYSDDNGSSWNTAYTWNASNEPSHTGQTYYIDLSSVNSATVQFALWASSGTTDDSEDLDFHLDNFVVQQVPSCRAPSVMTSMVNGTTADLAWTAGAGNNSYNIEYKAGADFVPGTGAEDVATTSNQNTLQVTGLSALTTYYVYLKGICSATESSSWTGPYTFTTGFAGNACSYQLRMIDSFGDGWSGNTMDVLVDGVTILDDVALDDDPNNDQYVGILDFDVADGLGITTIWNGGGSYGYETSYEIIDSSGAVVGSGAESNINNPITASCPACSVPSNLMVSAITGSSADVSWIDNAGSGVANVEYGPAGFTLGNGTTINANGITSITLTNLSSGTDYDVYVIQDCTAQGNGTSESLTSFTTIAGCGDQIYDTGGSSGDYSNDEDYTITYYPENPGELVTLDFTFVVLEDCCDDLSVYDGIDTSAPAFATDLESPASFTATNVDGAITIRFQSDSSIVDAGWEATYSCGPPASCLEPTALMMTGTSFDSIDISWTEGSATGAAVIEYGLSGFTLGTGTTQNATGTTATITGLSASTTYDIYVYQDCSGSGNGLSVASTVLTASTQTDYCGSEVTDAGGSSNYSNNSDEIYTICPTTPGDQIMLNFLEFSFENSGSTGCYDFLTLYDGNSLADPTIDNPNGSGWCWDRNDQPALGSGDLQGMIIVSTHPSGCITVRLQSDSSVTRSGFRAAVYCINNAFTHSASGWNTIPENNITSSDIMIVQEGTASLTAGVSANQVFISNGATLTADFGDINVSGDVTNSGVINGSSSLVLNGNSAQDMDGNGGMIQNLTIDNATGVVMNGEQFVTSNLEMLNGTLTTNGNLTLTSDANRTAVVHPVPTTASISGQVTTERFIPGKRAYRFVTSSVDTGSSSIRDNWQNGGSVIPNYGTHITGGASNPNLSSAAAGFDVTYSNQPSMFRWDNLGQQWYEVVRTDGFGINLQAGTPYRLFVRGDRQFDLTDPNPETQTSEDTRLQATGSLVIGDWSTGNLGNSAGDFGFVGNPYMAPVDMDGLLNNSSININPNFYYVWDPTAGTYGAYTTYDLVNDTNSLTGSSVDNTLRSGQAAFILVNTSPAVITFQESFKVVDEFTNAVFSDEPKARIQVGLYGKNDDLAKTARDGFVINLDSNSVGVDAPKMDNPYENMSILKNGNRLSIASITIDDTDQVVPIHVSGVQDNSYVLVLDLNNIPSEFTVYLSDNRSGELAELKDGVNQRELQFSGNDTDAFAYSLVFKSQGMDTAFAKAVTLYPNPVDGDELTILKGAEWEGPFTFRLINVIGQEVAKGTGDWQGGKFTLSGMNARESGVYYLLLGDGTNSTTEKLVIK